MSQRARLIAAVLGSAVSGVVLYRFFAKPALMDDSSKNLFDACVQVTAQDVSRLLGVRGDVVVLMWGPPADDAKDPAGPPDVQAFCKALPRGGLHLLAKEKVPPVPAGYDIVWTEESYHLMLERYSQAGALVSFVGAPPLSPEGIGTLPSMRPKLVVARGAKTETVRELLQQGVVDGAVLPSGGPPASSRPPKTTREWSDKYYLFVTPATVSELGG